MSCNRCKGTSTDPFNFLLSCSECGKRWHHRCHAPPLSDPDLTALVRATNDNDIDNGLSSWIGKCCKRKRVQAQSIPNAVSRPAEVPLFVSPAAPAVPSNAASVRQVSQKTELSSAPTQSTHFHDQTTGVAAPLKHDGEHTTRDLGSPSPQTPMESQMTNLVRSAVQRSATVTLDMAAAKPEQSRTMPLPSTSSTASPSGNVTSTIVPHSRPAHLREISLPLARTPPSPSQPTGPTYVQTHSQSSKRTSSASGSVGPALAMSEPIEIDIDPPTLDLRALSLTRASNTPPGSSFDRKTASRPLSLPPPPRSSTRPVAAAEDDEIEELSGPPLGLPSIHAQPLLPPRETSLQQPPSKPRLLPVLAAEDPRTLATLERHEQREAARPRQGMRKAQAVRRAGGRRGGFVLVADVDANAARARPTDPSREPRGVFAAYFARSGV